MTAKEAAEVWVAQFQLALTSLEQLLENLAIENSRRLWSRLPFK